MIRRPEKVIAYLRVSTDRQAESGLGLDAQRSAIQAYCDANGLALCRTYVEEGVSGGKPFARRPVGRKVLRVLEMEPGLGLVVSKLCRGFRNATDFVSTVKKLEEQGNEVHIIDQGGRVTGANATARMVYTIIAAVVQWERDIIAERTREAARAAKAKGLITGTLPYGYCRLGKGKKLKPYKPEMQILYEVWQDAGNGVRQRETARRLNLRGARTRKGTPFTQPQIAKLVSLLKNKPGLLQDVLDNVEVA